MAQHSGEESQDEVLSGQKEGIPSSGNFKEKGKAIYLSKGFDRIMTQARTLSVLSETVVID